MTLTEENNRLKSKNRELVANFEIATMLAGEFIRYACPYTTDEAREISYKKGYYPFVPQSISYVLPHLRKAREASRKAQSRSRGWMPYFLDAGCGVGNIMRLADLLGYVAHGVERCRKNVRVARKINDAILGDFGSGSRVFCGDVFNFKHYNKYDAIYYYCPIENRPLQRKFEQMVEDKMKVGAALVSAMKVDERIRTDERFKKLDTILYVKISK